MYTNFIHTMKVYQLETTNKLVIFIVRWYASAVYAMALHLSVSVISVFY